MRPCQRTMVSRRKREAFKPRATPWVCCGSKFRAPCKGAAGFPAPFQGARFQPSPEPQGAALG